MYRQKRKKERKKGRERKKIQQVVLIEECNLLNVSVCLTNINRSTSGSKLLIKLQIRLQLAAGIRTHGHTYALEQTCINL